MIKKIIISDSLAASKDEINYTKYNAKNYLLITALGSYVYLRSEPDVNSTTNIITVTDGTKIYFKLIGFKRVPPVGTEGEVWYYIEFTKDYPQQENVSDFNILGSTKNFGSPKTFKALTKDPVRGYTRCWINESGVECIAAEFYRFIESLDDVTDALDEGLYVANALLDSPNKRLVRLRKMSHDEDLDYDAPLGTPSSLDSFYLYQNDLTDFETAHYMDDDYTTPWSTTSFNPSFRLFHHYTHFYKIVDKAYQIFDFSHILLAVEGNTDLSRTSDWPFLFPIDPTEAEDTIWAGDCSAAHVDKYFFTPNNGTDTSDKPGSSQINRYVFDYRKANQTSAVTLYSTIVNKVEVQNKIRDFFIYKTLPLKDLHSDMFGVGLYHLYLKDALNGTNSVTFKNQLVKGLAAPFLTATETIDGFISSSIQKFLDLKGFKTEAQIFADEKVEFDPQYIAKIYRAYLNFTYVWYWARYGSIISYPIPPNIVLYDGDATIQYFANYLNKHK